MSSALSSYSHVSFSSLLISSTHSCQQAQYFPCGRWKSHATNIRVGSHSLTSYFYNYSEQAYRNHGSLHAITMQQPHSAVRIHTLWPLGTADKPGSIADGRSEPVKLHVFSDQLFASWQASLFLTSTQSFRP